MEITVKIKAVSDKIGKEIPFPEYGSAGAAGIDLRACIDEDITLSPMERVLVPTGVAVALPDSGYAAHVMARSGLATKEGITLANAVGLIDSDYRGEIKVALINLSDVSRKISPGQRIAQLVIVPVCRGRLMPCAELDDTVRGEGGFGSTGKD